MEYVLNYETRKISSEEMDGTNHAEDGMVWNAWLTARPNVVCCGNSEREAIASLFFESVLAGWKRYFNPKQPGLNQGMADDPIQQAIDLLADSLRERVKERGSLILCGLNEECKVDPGTKTRLSELIGNLGTAIAALSRVKHD